MLCGVGCGEVVWAIDDKITIHMYMSLKGKLYVAPCWLFSVALTVQNSGVSLVFVLFS